MWHPKIFFSRIKQTLSNVASSNLFFYWRLPVAALPSHHISSGENSKTKGYLLLPYHFIILHQVKTAKQRARGKKRKTTHTCTVTHTTTSAQVKWRIQILPPPVEQMYSSTMTCKPAWTTPFISGTKQSNKMHRNCYRNDESIVWIFI